MLAVFREYARDKAPNYAKTFRCGIIRGFPVFANINPPGYFTGAS